MPTRTVNINQVEPRSWGFVRGRVDWSRITSLIEGPELERENQRARAFGRQFASQRPYTRLSVYDAQITDALGRPKNPATYTAMDQYLQESLFHRKNRNGWCFEARNTSTHLPEVMTLDPNTNQMTVVTLEPGQELATDSDVIIAIQCYSPRQQGFNNGLSMRDVIVVGELHMRTPGGGNSLDAYLQTLGITVNRPAQEPTAVSTISAIDFLQTTATEEAGVPVAPMAAPAPAAAPAPMTAPVPPMPTQPTGYSYSPAPTAPAADPAMQRPVYNQGGVGLNAPFDPDEF